MMKLFYIMQFDVNICGSSQVMYKVIFMGNNQDMNYQWLAWNTYTYTIFAKRDQRFFSNSMSPLRKVQHK